MRKGKKFQRPGSKASLLRGREKIKIGEPGYLNENCWLVKALNYAPYKRCQYCESKFRNCLFLHYQIISLILILFFLVLSFLIDGRISELAIVSIFTLVIIYGLFFNKTTDKIIQANFTERKAKEALGELTKELKERVDEQVNEIKELYKTREELLTIKENFLHIVSHQLRTPVSIFWGLLDNWETGNIKQLDKKKQERIRQQIIIAADRLQNTVNDMLDALELDRSLELEFEPVDIIAIIEEVTNTLKPNYDAKKLYLKIEKPKEKLPKIQASDKFLKQALMNLVDNAEKYTQTGGTTIIIKTDKENIIIEVRDTGMGLIEEDKKQIMKTQFFRGNRAQIIAPNGSGLGLCIVKQIIDKHHGEIKIDSAGDDKGTTFTIILPIEQKQSKMNKKSKKYD
jgi:signal transduction histidine kinase